MLLFENILTNCSFILLFLTMIFYWLHLGLFSSVLALKIGQYCSIFSNITILASLILRWLNSGHFPLSNLYESLIFLSWIVSTIYIILEKLTQKTFISGILSPTTLFINVFAVFNLPEEMRQISPLIPALKSNWLMMHVTVMILSYATLISGTLLSISFLIFQYSKFINEINLQDFKPKTSNNLILTSLNFQEYNFKFMNTLDNLSYRLISIGFSFLTIGILSGAVWANEAWGSYWSWDPKETWALITWIFFAIYLHTRLIKGWKGQKSAIIASFGFIALWICYLGVNLLGKGLHSYGWFF